MDELVVELKEIKKLLQVIVSNQEQYKKSNNPKIVVDAKILSKLIQVNSSSKEAEQEIKKVVLSEHEYYAQMIKEVQERFKEFSGIYPSQIFLVAEAGNSIPRLSITLF